MTPVIRWPALGDGHISGCDCLARAGSARGSLPVGLKMAELPSGLRIHDDGRRIDERHRRLESRLAEGQSS